MSAWKRISGISRGGGMNRKKSIMKFITTNVDISTAKPLTKSEFSKFLKSTKKIKIIREFFIKKPI